MVPGLAAVGAVYGLLLLKRRAFFWVGAAWLGLFLLFLQGVVLLVFPRLHIPIWAVLYPGKANAGGWVGLFAEKVWYLLIGVGNYFSGAHNLANYKTAFGSRPILYSMLLSWAVLAVALSVCILTLMRRPGKSGGQLLAVFAIALFVVGEAGAVYSQPQDPQMQIQPMFAAILGIILLVRRRRGGTETFWRVSVVGVLAVVGIANGARNIHLMRLGTGQDSKAIADIEEMDSLFPRATTVIVSQGFEGWTTWQYVLLWRGNSEGFLRKSVHLARPFTLYRGIRGPDAAAMVTKQIDAGFANGLRVVAAALWTTPTEETVGSLTTVTDEADARAYVIMLRQDYRIGTRYNTRLGPFVELLPITPILASRP